MCIGLDYLDGYRALKMKLFTMCTSDRKTAMFEPLVEALDSRLMKSPPMYVDNDYVSRYVSRFLKTKQPTNLFDTFKYSDMFHDMFVH